MTPLYKIGLAAISVMVAWPVHADLISIPTSFGQGKDTYIQGTDSTSPTPINFGHASALTIKNGAAGDRFARKGYLGFDLTQITGPITSASLQLTVSLNNSGGTDPVPSSFTVEVLGLLDSLGLDGWVEGNGGTDNNPLNEITWVNAPANVTSSGINFVSGQFVSLGFISVTTLDLAGSQLTLASTPELVEFLNSDTDNIATIMLRRTGTNAGGQPNLTFHSKESGPSNVLLHPTLSVEFIPEPSSALLVLVGSVFLWRMRRT